MDPLLQAAAEQALKDLIAEIEWWVKEHGCCAGHEDKSIKAARAVLSRIEAAKGKPDQLTATRAELERVRAENEKLWEAIDKIAAIDNRITAIRAALPPQEPTDER